MDSKTNLREKLKESSHEAISEAAIIILKKDMHSIPGYLMQKS
jgi:hypothetical protein